MSYSKAGSSAAVGAINRTRDDVNPISGLCGACNETCLGLCEVGRSAIRGPEIIYPQPFGDVTAAAVKAYPFDWGHFNILGTAKGAHGIEADSDQATFANVKVETVLAAKNGKEGIRLGLPVTVPGLGSTDIARKHWQGLAAGCALSGVLLTIGENVVGMDMSSEFEKGKVRKSPALEERFKLYREWQRDKVGAIICQENVEDSRSGVLEYALTLGADAVELKWGQGAKNIGGEVKIKNLEKAQELRKRGYIVLPDPMDKNVIEAFKKGVFREFERHSRLGMVTEEGFAARVEALRKAGAKYIFLKTGAYRFADLARAVAYCSKYGVDVLTVDAAGGGTGMSPWRMMNEWGTPPIETFQKTVEYTNYFAQRKKHVPDLVFAGGFTLEDHIFKGLAFGAPHARAIGMARGPLTAAMITANLWKRIETQQEEGLMERYGRNLDEVFYGMSKLRAELGDKAKTLPAGGVGVYTYFMRVEQGLKQLLAGARKFNIAKPESSCDRNDLIALTQEAAALTGIAYIMEHDKAEAESILAAAAK